MASVEGLCGGVVGTVQQWWWILFGLTPGLTYNLRDQTSDALHPPPASDYVNCLDGSSRATLTANACGVAAVSAVDIVPTSYHLALHVAGDNGQKSGSCKPPPTGRIVGDFDFVVAGAAAPNYLVAGTLAGTAIPCGASLSWPAATGCASGMSLVYSVYRCQTGGCSPTAGTLVGTTSGLSYVDTGLTIGTSYRYQIRVDADIGCGLLVGNDSIGAVNYSNIVTVVGTPCADYWGAIYLN